MDYLYFLHPVVYFVLKVFLGAIGTMVDYKSDIAALVQ
jgi:hypothetical protein